MAWFFEEPQQIFRVQDATAVKAGALTAYAVASLGDGKVGGFGGA